MQRNLAIEESKGAAFARALVTWYDPARRPFPWRESRDPYYIALCEILLQRTNAEKVETAAEALMHSFPTLAALVSTDREELLRILQPLGLPRRAEYVQALAETVARARAAGREVTHEELEVVPGVGPYARAAIGVLAYNKPDAVIDEHVLRIFRRVFSVHAPERRHPTKPLIALARSLVPIDNARAYNLALLDLGRLVCRPKNPRCEVCPVQPLCDYAREHGKAA